MTFYPKMDPEVKQLWLRALRSGDFKQGTNYLNQVTPDGGNEYCCLGVLCELAVSEIGTEPAKPAGRGAAWIGRWLYYGGNATYLPQYVKDWSGISGLAQTHLSKLNDSARRNFNEIADWIEAEL